MKSQATSCMVNFVRGLISPEDEEDDKDLSEKEKLARIQVIKPYA